MPDVVDKWVVSIVGRIDVERAFDAVDNLRKEQGLELDRIQLLSGDQVPSLAKEAAYSCAEFWVYGELKESEGYDEPRMRAEFKALAETIDFDLAVQTEREYKRERKLFVFDMDSTLIQGETIDELAKMAGVGQQVAEVTAAAMRGEIEFQESFRRRMALLKGLPESRVLEVLQRIPIMEGAERLFRTLKARGAKTAILSGGFTFFGFHLKELLGVDHVYANEFHVEEGLATGEVQSRIVDGLRKAELIEHIARIEDVAMEQVVAVGDGANDLPMLRLAGMGIAFHAKPVVRAEARFTMSHVGLDGLLYLLGIPDWEWA